MTFKTMTVKKPEISHTMFAFKNDLSIKKGLLM